MSDVDDWFDGLTDEEERYQIMRALERLCLPEEDRRGEWQRFMDYVNGNPGK